MNENSTKTCFHQRISMGNYVFQIFKKFHLENCKNLANFIRSDLSGFRISEAFHPKSEGGLIRHRISVFSLVDWTV